MATASDTPALFVISILISVLDSSGYTQTISNVFQIPRATAFPKSVLSSLPWSTDVVRNISKPTTTNQAVQDPSNLTNPILETYPSLLNTSFHGYSSTPIVTFRTNEATLQIIDTAAKDFEGRISVQRIIINPQRPNIFVSEAMLSVPFVYNETLNTSELPIDYSFLDTFGMILASPPFATGTLPLRRNATGQILVIGLGGGQMSSFLHYYFPQLNITVVELQPAIGFIAKKYFGFREDATQHLLIMDGLKYLEDAARNGQKFDAIYIDACPSVYPLEKEILCPRNSFLNSSTIRDIHSVLSDDGTFSIKMLLITEDVTNRAIQLSQPFREIFTDCIVLPMISRNNRILICTGKNRGKLDPLQLWNEMMAFHPPYI